MSLLSSLLLKEASIFHIINFMFVCFVQTKKSYLTFWVYDNLNKSFNLWIDLLWIYQKIMNKLWIKDELVSFSFHHITIFSILLLLLLLLMKIHKVFLIRYTNYFFFWTLNINRQKKPQINILDNHPVFSMKTLLILSDRHLQK